MNEEMEIMKWIDTIGKGPPHTSGYRQALQHVKNGLEDAVKREIVRAFYFLSNVMPDDLRTRGAREFIQQHIDTFFAPKPKYCGGMQEAIDEGAVIKANSGNHYNFFNSKLKGITVSMNLNRCPFCPDGENCIKN